MGNVAVIGCGYWGKNLVRNFQQLGALEAVCDVTAAGRATAASLAPQAKIVADLEEVLASAVPAVAIATPAGELHLTQATCEGRIACQPRGEHGFGYDPIFLLPERGQTMAELSPEEKNQISHWARAVAQAREILRTLV